MSRADIQKYFAEIGEWMKTDISREIKLAQLSSSATGKARLAELEVPSGGGNLLAALGLVAYTEALGRLRLWNVLNRNGGDREVRPKESKSFSAFFDAMADGQYKKWWAAWKPSRGKTAYEVLRNGLVHEYQPKVDAEIHIGTPEGLGLEDRDGVLIVRVEAYYRDFCAEVDVLKRELLEWKDPEAEIPLASGMPTSQPLDYGPAPTYSVASRAAGPIAFTSVKPTSGHGDEKPG